MQTQPAEPKEYNNARPEDPLVLPSPPFNHPDRVPRHPKRVGDRVKLLLRPLEHLPLRAQVAQHRLAPRNVLVQRRVSASEEVLLPQRVVLPCDVVAAHAVSPTAADARPTTRIPHMATRATIPPIRARRARSIGILRRGGIRPAPQELAAVLGVERVVAGGLEGFELAAVFGQLGAEVAYALVGFLLFRWVELLPREGVVLVDGALEGG